MPQNLTRRVFDGHALTLSSSAAYAPLHTDKKTETKIEDSSSLDHESYDSFVFDVNGVRVSEKDSISNKDETKLRGQILLGMLASPQPYETMTSVIEDFDAAGVRFVFFFLRSFDVQKL